MAEYTPPPVNLTEPHLDHPGRTFFRFFRYLAPYWDKMLFVCLAIVVASPLSQLQLVFTRKIFDECLNPATVFHEPADRWVRLLLYTAIGGGLLWTSRVIDVLHGFMNFFMDFHLTMNLRKMFYKHLHRLPFAFFQNRPIGEHMFRCMNDVSGEWGGFGVVNMITGITPTMFRVLNDMMWQGLLVLFFNPTAFYMVMGFIGPYTYLQYMMNTRIKRAFFAQRLQDQLVPAVLRDSIAGVETLKSYGRSRHMARKYSRQLTRAVRAAIRRDWLYLLLNNIVLWIPSVLLYGIIWTYLIYQFMAGKISLGTYTLSITVSYNLAGPFRQIVDYWQLMRQQLVPAQRILQTLDVEPAIQDLPGARPLPRVSGAITFENVRFAYDPEVPVLKDVSFSVEPGQTLGIIGRSGAGKTTIINLLLRLHRPDAGRILIDGHDLDRVRIVDWQDQLAIVMQETSIFGGDVTYNVRYGKLKATEEEIREALRIADADEFVEAMPGGIHANLYEGAKLSGGQKQRIGIARAMVRKPRVLLLDEPTSSLDSRTENEIWRSFEKAMAGCTTLIISHRLATVRKADKIIVMVDGVVAEQGSHEDLLARKGTYYSMWLEQTGQAEEEAQNPAHGGPRPVPAVAAAKSPALRPLPPEAAPPPALPDFGFSPALQVAGMHPPRRGQALDLLCQHELTPDLTRHVRTTRGQLKTLRFAARYLIPVWHLVLLHFVIVVPFAMVMSLAPWINALVINYAQPQQNWTIFWIALIMGWSIIVALTFGLVTHWPRFINAILMWYLGMKIRYRMRLDFYRHLHRCSLRFFERRPVGEHMYRAQDDIDSLVGLITTHLPGLIEAVLNFAVVLALAAWAISFNMTMVILLYLIPFYICYHLVFTLIRKVDREQRARYQRITATLQEGVSGVKTVKAFARQRHEMRKYIARHIHYYRMGVVRAWVDQMNVFLFGYIFTAGILPWVKGLILTLWAQFRVIFYGLPVGTANVVISYTNNVTNPITRIIELLNQIRLALIPAERVMETMSVEPMVRDKPHAKAAPPIRGQLSFENVRFSYDPGREVLRGASFTIAEGETIGIVGPSGAGKSTISKLALRLYDPDSGRVAMDGWDIADIKAETYQGQIGTVMQETYLFAGSIRDNILFSKPRATEEDIRQAIDAADLKDFIDQLPQGLDTNLAEGTRLSGGQKQRIGIARALVRKPRLMILDEPTASLDSTTEAEVMQTLWKVMEGRTALVISHRLALVRRLDRILVVDGGRIVEEGSHGALLAQGGLYAELWREQYGEGSTAVA